MASNNHNDDTNAMINNIYRMVMEDLKAASEVCPFVECTEYFNHLLHQEVPDGTNILLFFIIW
jgi:hypothetical protein